MAPGLPSMRKWYIDDNANTGGSFRCRVVSDAGSVFGVGFGVAVVDVPPLVGLHCRPADAQKHNMASANSAHANELQEHVICKLAIAAFYPI
nr:hypothetical protein [uncultured Cohaesibacter sp.]